jgi:purine-nucleoside phosphorylase
MPTPHIGAEKGDFAKVVLMPGDPLRAKFVADNFLHDVKEVTHVRGILGYTGYTKNGKRISVMASGMGMPSIGIYSHELYTHYGVEAIIRIGTAGSYQKEIKVKDIVIAQGSCTDSNWMSQFELNGGTYSAIANYDMLEKSVNLAKEAGLHVHVGNVIASDVFYDCDPNSWKKWANLGVLAVEMESYALYVTAAALKKKALTILTMSDSFLDPVILTAEERQKGLVDMIGLAVATAENFAD